MWFSSQDGQIAIDELKAFYQLYGISTQDVQAVFHTLDLNSGGHIAQSEFQSIFAQFLQSDDVEVPGNWVFGVHLPM